MLKYTYLLTPTFFGIASLVASPFQFAQALSATDVNNIAEEVTVRIDGQNPGSGVIIKYQGNVYTVLTAAHVVATEDEYDLITPDGKRYPLDYKRIKKFPDIDLALVEFTSQQSYQLAELGDSDMVKVGELIYVSGFPVPTTAITETIYSFSEGKITANAKRTLADGYGLVYSNNTLPGMSGGPVLNNQGKLIGIHGRADGERQVKSTETVYVKTGFNLGIPINVFATLVAKVNPDIAFPSKIVDTADVKLTADDWFLQGVDNYNKGNYQSALIDLNKAINLNPDYANAFTSRGNTYQALKDYQRAIADHDKAIALNPTLALAYSNRGNAYQDLGDSQRAISNYDKAISLDPQLAIAYTSRGNAYSKLNEYPKALDDQNTAISLNPDFSIAYYNRGNIYFALKDHRKAILDFSQAIFFNPNFAYAYSNRGFTYHILKDHKNALDNYNKAISLDSKLSKAYRSRGVLYAESGEVTKAKQDLRIAATLFKEENNQKEFDITIQILNQL